MSANNKDKKLTEQWSSATGGAAHFDDLPFFQQFIALLTMAIDPNDPANDSLNNTLAGILGFDDVDSYKDYHAAHSADWKENFDFKHGGGGNGVDFDKAGKFSSSRISPTGDANFDSAMSFVLREEGGYNPNEPDGAIANFGINSKAHPEVDVKNLTVDKAMTIYKEDYWNPVMSQADKLGIELDKNQALIAFDAAVNHGPGFARKMLAATGGDTAAMLNYRHNEYHRLADRNPAKYGRYLNGWEKRLDHVAAAVTRESNATVAKVEDTPTSDKFNDHATGLTKAPQTTQVAEAGADNAANNDRYNIPSNGLS